MLKDTGRTSTGGLHRNRVRGLLVVSEVALAFVLLIGAGLMLRSFLVLRQVDPGFNTENVLTLTFWLPEFKYPKAEQQAAFYTEVLRRVETLPGVRASGAASILPLTGDNTSYSYTVEGQPAPPPGQELEAEVRAVSSGFLGAMSIPLLKGRSFISQDDERATKVIIINEAMARRIFGSVEKAVGKRLAFGDSDGEGDAVETEWREIVGVAGNVLHGGLNKPAEAEMYMPYLQSPSAFMSVVVRTAYEPGNLTAAIRREVAAVDKDQPILEVSTMRQRVSESVAPQRFSASLLMVFALFALLLASVGIYGVIAYSVTQRTHEIGIRMALGAQGRDVLRLVVGQGMVLALTGIGVGLVAAFALTRVLSSLLYGVSATDPVTFVSVALLLVAVALLACYIPARRATKVDPMVALRYE